MKNLGILLNGASAALLLVVVVAAMRAQSNGIPRTPDGKPDFSGTYEWPKAAPGSDRCKCSATIFDRKYFAPLKPGGEAFIEPHNGDPRHDEPRDFCMPAGFPSGMLSANAMQFFQTKDYLVMVHEFQRMSRVIPLDGRPHRKGQEPSFYGDPVGHWEASAQPGRGVVRAQEADTLVIETNNFKRWSLDDYFYTNSKEYRMHSDALVTTERLQWINKSTISYKLTIDDPKIFTRPWGQDFTIAAKKDWEKDGLYEYVCEENNRCPGGQCKGK